MGHNSQNLEIFPQNHRPYRGDALGGSESSPRAGSRIWIWGKKQRNPLNGRRGGGERARSDAINLL